METKSTEFESLAGHLLIAMPQMSDHRFVRTVIYMVAHTEDGAMGLVVNRLLEAITFPDLIEQLGVAVPDTTREIRIHFGGPVETGRGFVLHSSDYWQDATLQVDDQFSLTATVDVLRDIADGEGPRCCLLALGYAGWGPGQLETEIQNNGWLHVKADESLVFGPDLENRWEHAVTKIGFDPSKLSGDVGHA
ncbi:MAG: YqgE/AlgH family protein [Alphaproteobacteria bacterium]